MFKTDLKVFFVFLNSLFSPVINLNFPRKENHLEQVCMSATRTAKRLCSFKRRFDSFRTKKFVMPRCSSMRLLSQKQQASLVVKVLFYCKLAFSRTAGVFSVFLVLLMKTLYSMFTRKPDKYRSILDNSLTSQITIPTEQPLGSF